MHSAKTLYFIRAVPHWLYHFGAAIKANFRQLQVGTSNLKHRRMYVPALGRFVSSDSIVPGAASGAGGGAATLGVDGSSQLTPLTVDFHEPGFVATLDAENQQRFWFQMSDEERQKAGRPWGPANPQALNRYSYVLNNPLHYTDPSGHYLEPDHGYGTPARTYDTVQVDPVRYRGQTFVDNYRNIIYVDPGTGVLYRKVVVGNGLEYKYRLYTIHGASGVGTKYVYEDDPEFQSYKRHADKIGDAATNIGLGAVSGAVGGCIGGASFLGVGCIPGAIGGAAGGAAVGFGSYLYILYSESEAGLKNYDNINSVGKPRLIRTGSTIAFLNQL